MVFNRSARFSNLLASHKASNQLEKKQTRSSSSTSLGLNTTKNGSRSKIQHALRKVKSVFCHKSPKSPDALPRHSPSITNDNSPVTHVAQSRALPPLPMNDHARDYAFYDEPSRFHSQHSEFKYYTLKMETIEEKDEDQAVVHLKLAETLLREAEKKTKLDKTIAEEAKTKTLDKEAKKKALKEEAQKMAIEEEAEEEDEEGDRYSRYIPGYDTVTREEIPEQFRRDDDFIEDEPEIEIYSTYAPFQHLSPIKDVSEELEADISDMPPSPTETTASLEVKNTNRIPDVFSEEETSYISTPPSTPPSTQPSTPPTKDDSNTEEENEELGDKKRDLGFLTSAMVYGGSDDGFLPFDFRFTMWDLLDEAQSTETSLLPHSFKEKDVNTKLPEDKIHLHQQDTEEDSDQSIDKENDSEFQDSSMVKDASADDVPVFELYFTLEELLSEDVDDSISDAVDAPPSEANNADIHEQPENPLPPPSTANDVAVDENYANIIRPEDNTHLHLHRARILRKQAEAKKSTRPKPSTPLRTTPPDYPSVFTPTKSLKDPIPSKPLSPYDHSDRLTLAANKSLFSQHDPPPFAKSVVHEPLTFPAQTTDQGTNQTVDQDADDEFQSIAESLRKLINPALLDDFHRRGYPSALPDDVETCVVPVPPPNSPTFKFRPAIVQIPLQRPSSVDHPYHSQVEQREYYDLNRDYFSKAYGGHGPILQMPGLSTVHARKLYVELVTKVSTDRIRDAEGEMDPKIEAIKWLDNYGGIERWAKACEEMNQCLVINCKKGHLGSPHDKHFGFGGLGKTGYNLKTQQEKQAGEQKVQEKDEYDSDGFYIQDSLDGYDVDESYSKLTQSISAQEPAAPIVPAAPIISAAPIIPARYDNLAVRDTSSKYVPVANFGAISEARPSALNPGVIGQGRPSRFFPALKDIPATRNPGIIGEGRPAAPNPEVIDQGASLAVAPPLNLGIIEKGLPNAIVPRQAPWNREDLFKLIPARDPGAVGKGRPTAAAAISNPGIIDQGHPNAIIPRQNLSHQDPPLESVSTQSPVVTDQGRPAVPNIGLISRDHLHVIAPALDYGTADQGRPGAIIMRDDLWSRKFFQVNPARSIINQVNSASSEMYYFISGSKLLPEPTEEKTLKKVNQPTPILQSANPSLGLFPKRKLVPWLWAPKSAPNVSVLSLQLENRAKTSPVSKVTEEKTDFKKAFALPITKKEVGFTIKRSAKGSSLPTIPKFVNDSSAGKQDLIKFFPPEPVELTVEKADFNFAAEAVMGNQTSKVGDKGEHSALESLTSDTLPESDPNTKMPILTTSGNFAVPAAAIHHGR